MTNYNRELPDFGDLFTIEEFEEMVSYGALNDYDGVGKPVKDELYDWNHDIYPSDVVDKLIPEEATHILWFNK